MSRSEFRTPRQLVDRLKANSRVLGIVRYGGRGLDDLRPGGDLDLFAVIEPPPPEVEGIHFHVGGIPVDLSLRTLDDLALDEPVSFIDRALIGGEICYDPTGRVAEAIREIERVGRWAEGELVLTEGQHAWERFCQRHVLDKVVGRTESHGLLSAFLMHTNIYWMTCAYFRVRGLAYPGEKPALAWLTEHDPQYVGLMKRFYATTNLEAQLQLSVEMTTLALEPIGGAWRNGEVLALGRDDQVCDLQTKGRALYQQLLGVEMGEQR